MHTEVNQKNYTPMIIIVTVVLISAITILLRLPGIENFDAFDITILPLLNAILNVFTLLFLVLAYLAIKRGKEKVHRRFIYAAIVATALFLICYVIFHTVASATPFGGDGMIKWIYYFILTSHIVLAITTIPLVLFSITSTWNRQFKRHKKIARWTMPIWMYVSLTGVLVYLLIRPYY